MRLQKPPGLVPGSRLGVVAPAGYPDDPASVARGVERLKGLGFRIVMGTFAGRKTGYLAGADGERAADLMTMFTDPGVDGIICLRGGYGSMRLLTRLDFPLIARHPKVLVGFSDITALHLALHRHSKLVTFHGPMAASDFGGGATEFTLRQFRKAVMRPGRIGTIIPPRGREITTIVGGRAKGPLIGGNLTLVTAALGTDFEINTRGRILFLEEIGEEAYRVDRMLTQLKLAGKLGAAAGIVFGYSTGKTSRGVGPAEVAGEILREVGVPAVYGLPIGHEADQATLPLGVEAELDASAGRLAVTESGVV